MVVVPSHLAVAVVVVVPSHLAAAAAAVGVLAAAGADLLVVAASLV